MDRSKYSFAALLASVALCGAAFGDVTGTVKLDGKPPERKQINLAVVPGCAGHKGPLLDETIVADANGNLQNVVVYLKGDNIKGIVPAQPAVLDQKDCQYVPHFVAMMVGQTLVARNDDPFLHNVHTHPEDNDPTNIAQPNKDPGTALKLITSAEFFPVTCDVHPWMKGWVAALDNQYFAVTGENGTFTIDTRGLPDGEYEIHAWQERLREAPVGKVTVKDGKGEANFTFKPRKAATTGPADPAKSASPKSSSEANR
jgi:plastocyanin